MKVTFWGVRGSIPTSGPEYARFGGNTTCVEVEAAGERLIIDAGTGLRPLGQKLFAEAKERGGPVRATMLFTHLHWDHIQGFPFFGPGFVPSTELDLFGPCDGDASLERALEAQMTTPQFPVPLSTMAARKRFHCIASGMAWNVGDVVVRTRALAHPQGSLGYRIEADGEVFCFATDTEHPSEQEVDEALLDLAKDADLFVHDAQFTPAEYPSKKGWGHSTFAAAAKAAKAAGAKTLGLFHHDPGHDDAFVQGIERESRLVFDRAFAAREGLTLHCR